MSNNVLEFFVKMKDMMSGGLAKLAQNSQKTFSQVQGGIDKTVQKNNELANSFDKVSSKAQSSGAGIGKWVKGLAIAGAAVGLLTAGLAFGKDSVGKAMEFGKTKESFKVLTGSDKKGVGLANDLNKLQQQTILGPEVFKSAQTMLGFGIQTEKVLPTMKMLGDISMGDAQKMESLTLAFSQISSAGKLSGQDLLQMINAGFNPLNEISKKTGISIGDLKKQMEKGGISAKMVEDAMISATSAGGSFNGMMAKLAETPAGKLAQLEGAFEGFQVKVGEALMPIATMLMDLAQPLLDIAATYLPYIAAAITSVLSIFQGVGGETNNWSYYLQGVGEVIGIVWDGLSSVFKVVWHILGGVLNWIGKSEILKDAFNVIKTIIMVVWDVIKWIADKISWLWDNVISPILDALESAYKWVKSLFGGDEAEVNVKINKDGAAVTTSVPAPSNTTSSSLTATQAAGKDGGLGSMASLKKSDAGGDVAKGIAGGGPRVINITIGKMVEKLEVHALTMQEGLQDLEHQVEEVFLRVLNSGASVQGAN
jgi:tape measure domain-containing protein